MFRWNISLLVTCFVHNFWFQYSSTLNWRWSLNITPKYVLTFSWLHSTTSEETEPYVTSLLPVESLKSCMKSALWPEMARSFRPHTNLTFKRRARRRGESCSTPTSTPNKHWYLKKLQEHNDFMLSGKVQASRSETKVILLRRYFMKVVVHQKENNALVLSVQTVHEESRWVMVAVYQLGVVGSCSVRMRETSLRVPLLGFGLKFEVNLKFQIETMNWLMHFQLRRIYVCTNHD
jgi:hypothetical protein